MFKDLAIKMAQGKPWKKEEIVELLKPKFQLGMNVERACKAIQFPSTTFKTWLGEDELLRLKVEAWQGETAEEAIKALKQSIKDGTEESAKWWLERKEKDEFGQKVISENKNTNVNAEVKDDNDRARIIRDAIKGLSGEENSK